MNKTENLFWKHVPLKCERLEWGDGLIVATESVGVATTAAGGRTISAKGAVGSSAGKLARPTWVDVVWRRTLDASTAMTMTATTIATPMNPSVDSDPRWEKTRDLELALASDFSSDLASDFSSDLSSDLSSRGCTWRAM